MGRHKYLLTPYFLWLFFLVIGPFALVLAISFFRRSPLGLLEPGFSFNAYSEVAQGVFLPTMFRTLWIAALNTLATLICAYPLAYVIARTKRYQLLLLSLVLIPFWTNYLIRVLAFMDFLRLEPFGMSLIFSTPGVLGALVYTYVPFALLPLYSNMRTLDFSLLEAARDLGANSWQVFWKLLFPLTKGGLRNAALFVFVPSLGEFLIPELVSGGKLYLLGSLLQHQFMTARNWPAGAAIITLVTYGLLLLFIAARRGEKV